MVNNILREPARALAILFAGLACALAGCTDKRGGPIPYDVAMALPDPAATTALDAGYKIAPLDKLSIKVFKMEDLTGEYEVDLAGNISMPLIGEVKATDVTTAELDQRLTQKLGEKYLENPDVSVGIKEAKGRLVTVDGAVKEPGAYPAPAPITLIQAIALARGTTEDANARRVAVFRTISGRRQAAAFDLVSIRRGQTPDPMLYPGDIVVVDGGSLREVQKRILNALPVLSIFRPF